MFRATPALFAAVLLLSAASPARADLSPTACQAAKAYSDQHDGLSVLVLKNGKVACEAYTGGDADTAHELYSGTKSFVGLMAAAAVQDRLLTLDELVADTLPEWRDDPLKSKATIRQLLSMTAGLPSQIGRPPTYAGAVEAPFNLPPGERFQYGPAPMQVFGELIRRKLTAAGRSGDPLAYLKARILDPIGLKDADWRRGPDGQPMMPQGAVLTAREWAKVGELVRHRGVVDGRAIVDPEAFDALFHGSRANPGYGLTWWLPKASITLDAATASTDIGAAAASLPKDLVMAAGAGDQRLYVIPSLGLVIVRQARLDLVKTLRAARGQPIADEARWSDAKMLDILIGGRR